MIVLLYLLNNLTLTAAAHIALCVIHSARSQILIVSLSISQSSRLIDLTPLHYAWLHGLCTLILGIREHVRNPILSVPSWVHIACPARIGLFVVLKLLFNLLVLFYK